MNTQVQFSQKAMDVMVIEECLVSHRESLTKKMCRLSEMRKRLGWICDIPGSGGPELARDILSMSTQMETMLILRDAILNCPHYPNAKVYFKGGS